MTAIILAGGPSAPPQFEQARIRYPDATLVSVNHHGVLFGLASLRGRSLIQQRLECGEREPVLVHAEYAVALDEWDKHCPDIVCDRARIVGPWKNCHIHIGDFPKGTGSSAMAAVWWVLEQGMGPAIICGVDLYRDGTYWHAPTAKSSGTNSVPEYHLREWWRHIPSLGDPEQMRAAGGALVPLIGRMGDASAWGTVDFSEAKERLTVNVKLYNAQGDEIEVPADRADDLIRQGWMESPPPRSEPQDEPQDGGE